MISGKRKRALKFFPLVLGILLSGLPFWTVFHDYGTSLAVLPEPQAWEKTHPGSESHLYGNAGTTLIYSFQPWGGVSLEASEVSVSQTGPQPASVHRQHVAPRQTAGKKDIVRDAFTSRHKRSLPPATVIYRLQHANWMMTS